MAATDGAMAAVCPSCSAPATSCAASAVDEVATATAWGSSRRRNDRHWAVATGMDSTRRTSPSPTPLGASRFICTPITTSRWMSRSVSKARLSTVTVTAPSIEFSTATKPRSTRSSSTAASTSGMDGRATRSWAARSAWDSRACSVNVPSGPRKPMVARPAVGIDECHAAPMLPPTRRRPLAGTAGGAGRRDGHRPCQAGLWAHVSR